MGFLWFLILLDAGAKMPASSTITEPKRQNFS
jgi:hypothetical protein